jgi:hypothetical protein
MGMVLGEWGAKDAIEQRVKLKGYAGLMQSRPE